MVEPVRHRQTKEAAKDMFEPKATASHLDSTVMRIKADIECAQAARHWSALIIAGEMQRPFPNPNRMPQDDSTFEGHQKGQRGDLQLKDKS